MKKTKIKPFLCSKTGSFKNSDPILNLYIYVITNILSIKYVLLEWAWPAILGNSRNKLEWPFVPLFVGCPVFEDYVPLSRQTVVPFLIWRKITIYLYFPYWPFLNRFMKILTNNFYEWFFFVQNMVIHNPPLHCTCP